MAKAKKKTATPAAEKRSSKEAGGFEQVFEQIYALVLKIPRGRVMTYGQIARLLDDRYSPRLVGWAMHATPQDARHIPWHRVINSRGGISTGKIILHEPDLQRLLLENEGILFNEKGLCDLSVYQWSPEKRKTKSSTAKAKKETENGNHTRKRTGHTRKI